MASYRAASKCFVENRQFVNPPGRDLNRSLAWNLNQGLANLAESIESDIGGLEQRLDRIEHLLAKLVRQS